MRTAAIVLAAGASRRMRGTDKLTEDAGGRPLLRRVVEQVLASAADDVVVVLGARSEQRRETLAGLSVVTIGNTDWQSGMASSICAGIGALDKRTDAAMILLGDMPDVDAGLIDRLIEAFDPDQGAEIIVPRTITGRSGNPVLFGRRHFPALLALSGDRGARDIIAENPHLVREVLADDSILTDLDTPEAWTQWRNGKQS